MKISDEQKYLFQTPRILAVVYLASVLHFVQAHGECILQFNANNTAKPEAHGGCKVVINEFNANNPVKPEKREFIELSQLCSGNGNPKSDSLQGYKILGISSTTNRGYTINLVANLWNFRLKENGLFVMGGTEVPNTDLSIENSNVKCHTKFTKGTMSLFSFISNANKKPAAIALVYSKNGLPDIDLSKINPFLNLKDHLHTIKTHLHDLIVYGRRTPVSECDIFHEIYPDYEQNYVIHDYDEVLGTDYSLNRCGLETKAFMPDSYKIGKPTPGEQNDCSGVRFILEKHIDEIMNPVTDIIQYDMPGCSSSLPINIAQAITTENYVKAVQTSLSAHEFGHCTPLVLRMDDAEADDFLVASDTRKRKMGVDTERKEWETKSFFRQEWIKAIEQYQKKLFPISVLDRDDVQVWFKYIPDLTQPGNSKYECRLCSKYYDHFKLDKRYRPALASPFLGGTYNKNQQKIREHPLSLAHQEVIKKLKLRYEENIPDQFDMIQAVEEMEDSSFYKVTARMIRSVYVEAKANVPFNSHKDIVLLQKKNGIDIGVHHYEKYGATEMMSVISKEMHGILLESMISSQTPLSIIVDESTDSNGHHYLIVFFQALEDQRPVIYFYKLVLLSADETAEGLLRSLTEVIKAEKKDLYQYLKNNLIGFASDGASVMTGIHNGLIRKLEAEFGKKLYGIHCMAHRLHLALRKPFDSIKVLNDFEDTINAVYHFYNSKGHKKKAHLRALAYALGYDTREIGYIYKERWISSEYTALKQFNNTWLLICKDLEAISIDGHFNTMTQATARGLYEKIESRIFTITLQFLLDLLSSFSDYNLLLQRKVGLLIGKEKLRQNMLKTPNLLKTVNAANLDKFLKTVKCSDTTRGPCTEQQFINSESVKWQGIELEKSKTSLNDYRVQLLDGIIDQVTSYFPEGPLSHFDIFEPQSIPNTYAEIDVYGVSELNDLCTIFGWDCNIIIPDWRNLLKSIIDTNEFCHYRQSSPQAFWPRYLQNNNIIWSVHIRKVIQTLLILPIGSADAERGFSVMNHIRGTSRYNLSPSHLDDLMRIRLNGPDNLEEFPAVRYAKTWIAENHLPTDDPRQQRKKVKLTLTDEKDLELEKEYFPKSTIF